MLPYLPEPTHWHLPIPAPQILPDSVCHIVRPGKWKRDKRLPEGKFTATKYITWLKPSGWARATLVARSGADGKPVDEQRWILMPGCRLKVEGEQAPLLVCGIMRGNYQLAAEKECVNAGRGAILVSAAPERLAKEKAVKHTLNLKFMLRIKAVTEPTEDCECCRPHGR